MLLSMYASYHYAKLGKKDYIRMITVFVILVSFCSAHFPAGGIFIAMFFVPFSFLSFPFYVYIDEILVEPTRWVEVVRIRLLTVDIASSYPMVGWIDVQSIANFSFFLLVNVLGVLSGYWMRKKYRIQFFGSNWWTYGIVSVGLGLVLVMLGVGYFVGENIGITLFGFGIFLLEAIFLSKTWHTI